MYYDEYANLVFDPSTDPDPTLKLLSALFLQIKGFGRALVNGAKSLDHRTVGIFAAIGVTAGAILLGIILTLKSSSSDKSE